MELGSDMEYLFQSFDNTRLKKLIETVLSMLFPVRIGSNKAACHRPWWDVYQSHEKLDPFRPFERGEEGVKPAQEGSLETPTQRRNRVFMSPQLRDIERKADAARRQAAERNYGRFDISQLPDIAELSNQELERSLKRLEADSLRTSLAD